MLTLAGPQVKRADDAISPPVARVLPYKRRGRLETVRNALF